jgi:hypothetical protein
LATKLVLLITGGSSFEPANKKQKKEAQRRVQHVRVQGPYIKSKWSHVPITFSQEDLQLKDYPHNDAMVISCAIKGFLVHNVLVDIGSVANIIFAKAFRQMQEQEDKIHDATYPLCGFRGKQIVALGKITMPITFGYVHNTRTEQVVFDIVDMDYPYNAIIRRGTLNAFEAILHPAYLCMKIPSDQGPIAIHGSQEAARRAEGNWTNSRAIHNIDEAKAHQQHKYIRDKAASADQPKSMLLCEDIVEQKVLFGSQLSEEQENTLSKFLFNNRDVFAWSANDLCVVNRDVIEHSLNVDPTIRPRKQKLRKMSDDKAGGARNEVKRLLSAGVLGAIDQISSENVATTAPEALKECIYYIIRHALRKGLSQEEKLEAQHYAQKLKYPKGALVFNGSGEEDFLYCLPDNKEISVCREIGRSIGFLKL